MITCVVCHIEIKENEGTCKCGLDIHQTCELKINWYENKSYKDSVICCKTEEVYLRPTYAGGFLKCIGQCPKCSKVYVTSRFPKPPNTRKIHMPKKIGPK